MARNFWVLNNSETTIVNVIVRFDEEHMVQDTAPAQDSRSLQNADADTLSSLEKVWVESYLVFDSSNGRQSNSIRIDKKNIIVNLLRRPPAPSKKKHIMDINLIGIEILDAHDLGDNKKK